MKLLAAVCLSIVLALPGLCAASDSPKVRLYISVVNDEDKNAGKKIYYSFTKGEYWSPLAPGEKEVRTRSLKPKAFHKASRTDIVYIAIPNGSRKDHVCTAEFKTKILPAPMVALDSIKSILWSPYGHCSVKRISYVIGADLTFKFKYKKP